MMNAVPPQIGAHEYCPHCLHTLGVEYNKFDEANYETIHHTEVLNQLVKDGKLKPTIPVEEEVTYHDPCYLGRHAGTYDAPRELLESVPGIKINEMAKNKDKAQCCGMGGGNMWYEIHGAKDPVVGRLEHVGETKAPKLATACSYCMINFNAGKGLVKATEELQIKGISQILRKSVK